MEFLKPLAQYYYYLIYWLVIMFMTLSQFKVMIKNHGYYILYKRFDYRPISVFSLFYIIFYGFRPISPYFGDMPTYAANFQLLRDYGVFNMQGAEHVTNDVVFHTFQKLCANTVDVHLWFAVIMFFYIVMMLVGCKKIDYRHGALLMLFCVGSFQFYTYSVNGIRNGVACSFAIMAIGCLCQKKMLLTILMSILAIGCHKSVILPIAMMFFTYYVSKPKYMYLVWLIAIGLSLIIGGYIDNILSAIDYDERLANNLQGVDADGLVLEHRFRWDFLLYSSMPIILGWYTIFKRELYNKTYLIILGTYIYANAFWVLAIRAMFSNRIAYLSWFIYPIVLAYPLLNFPVFKKHHCEKTAWILLGHFGFTTILWLLGK